MAKNSLRQPIEYFSEIMADDDRGFSAYTVFIDKRRDVEKKYAVRIELSRWEIAAGIIDLKLRHGMLAHQKMYINLETVAPSSFELARSFFGPSFRFAL